MYFPIYPFTKKVAEIIETFFLFPQYLAFVVLGFIRYRHVHTGTNIDEGLNSFTHMFLYH